MMCLEMYDMEIREKKRGGSGVHRDREVIYEINYKRTRARFSVRSVGGRGRLTKKKTR